VATDPVPVQADPFGQPGPQRPGVALQRHQLRQADPGQIRLHDPADRGVGRPRPQEVVAGQRDGTVRAAARVPSPLATLGTSSQYGSVRSAGLPDAGDHDLGHLVGAPVGDRHPGRPP
jgi:hypothetical protein